MHPMRNNIPSFTCGLQQSAPFFVVVVLIVLRLAVVVLVVVGFLFLLHIHGCLHYNSISLYLPLL